MKYIIAFVFVFSLFYAKVAAQTDYYYFCGNDDGKVSFDDMIISVVRTGDSIKCYIHGNTDEFDSAREGYLPGFFVLEAKDFVMNNNHISFKINSNGYSFTNAPIDVFANYYSSEYPFGYKAWLQPNECFWKEIEYTGEYTQDSICLYSTNDYEFRCFYNKSKDFISQYNKNIMSAEDANMNSQDAIDVDYSESVMSFYKEYYDIMNAPNSVEKTSKLFALIDKYCTFELATIQKEEIKNGAGADFIAMEYIDELDLETLHVSKTDDYYLVSFNALRPQLNGNTVDRKVYLQVYLRNEQISDVKEKK